MVNIRLPAHVAALKFTDIFGTRVCPTSHEEALSVISEWVDQGRSRYVCCCNVHMIMEGWDDHLYQDVVNRADMVTPDGMPVVWYLRNHGHPSQDRVTGPDLMLNILERANALGWRIGLLGGESDTLTTLEEKLKKDYPLLQITYRFSPPFREASELEDAKICQDIRKAEVDVLFVGLGCPKQEKWMAEHLDRLSCVMLGVGAAFQFNAGQIKKAPEWIQKSGMEWFFRLCMEPRRLWKRYAKHNPRFIWLLVRERLSSRTPERASIQATGNPANSSE